MIVWGAILVQCYWSTYFTKGDDFWFIGRCVYINARITPRITPLLYIYKPSVINIFVLTFRWFIRIEQRALGLKISYKIVIIIQWTYSWYTLEGCNLREVYS